MLINQDLAYLEHERFVTLGRHGTQAYVSSCCQRSQAFVAVTVPFIVLKAAVESKKKNAFHYSALFIFYHNILYKNIEAREILRIF